MCTWLWALYHGYWFRCCAATTLKDLLLLQRTVVGRALCEKRRVGTRPGATLMRCCCLRTRTALQVRCACGQRTAGMGLATPCRLSSAGAELSPTRPLSFQSLSVWLVRVGWRSRVCVGVAPE